MFQSAAKVPSEINLLNKLKSSLDFSYHLKRLLDYQVPIASTQTLNERFSIFGEFNVVVFFLATTEIESEISLASPQKKGVRGKFQTV